MRHQWRMIAVAAVTLLGWMGAAEACPARPSPPSCLNKSAPFTPLEQAECVAKAQRYFEASDKYLGCLQEDVLREQAAAIQARSRLACRSTTKRPC